MGLLDSIVSQRFRDEEAGRVVVFAGDRRNRGYVVRSESEELKIRSFLKMFYLAHLSIFLLGLLLAFVVSWDLSYALGLRYQGVFLGACSLVVAVPYWLLWRSYKKALSSFVSVQDEVTVSSKNFRQQRWPLVIVGLGVLMFATLMLLTFCLTRIK